VNIFFFGIYQERLDKKLAGCCLKYTDLAQSGQAILSGRNERIRGRHPVFPRNRPGKGEEIRATGL
jgi:hypothetical protein